MLSSLCYHYQDVPESAKIVDHHNEPVTHLVYDGLTAVSKSSYRGRTVAVKVLHPNISHCEMWSSVSRT